MCSIGLCTKNKEAAKDAASDYKLPIVYSSEYNVSFCGLQRLHPFDAAKGRKIVQNLIDAKFITKDSMIRPNEMTKEDLLKVHTIRYLKSLKWSWNVAMIAEIPPIFLLPNSWVHRGYLKPMRFQTAGSVEAAKLAVRDGWAINLGGGFHHCCADKGGGFCPYADITLAIKTIMDEENGINSVMIVDLDAHQGNGHERDFKNSANIYIMDMYNCHIYPKDEFAKTAIRKRVELKLFTEDDIYLQKLTRNLNESLEEFMPDLIVFNAGTDILKGDPLGLLSVTPNGVIERDEIVFSMASKRNIPIVMLLSGGYLRSSAKVISDSILNLFNKGLLRSRV